MECVTPVKLETPQCKERAGSLSNTPLESGQPRPRLSERRYTPSSDSLELIPSQNAQGGFSYNEILKCSQDSLEYENKPCNKLLTFSGEIKRIQPNLNIPLGISKPKHKRKLSLNFHVEEILADCKDVPKSIVKDPKKLPRRKTVSFCSEVEQKQTYISPAHSRNSSLIKSSIDSVVYLGSGTIELDDICIKDSNEPNFKTCRDEQNPSFYTATSTAQNSVLEDKCGERLSTIVITSSGESSGKKNLNECSVHIESLWPEDKRNSTTAANTLSTLGNIQENDPYEDSPGFLSGGETFKYEQEVKASGILQLTNIDAGARPFVAFCGGCEREVVTVVSYEGNSMHALVKVLQAFCCCSHTWALRDVNIVHSCSYCRHLIAKFSA
jgi:hypothetical protein